MSNIYKKQEAEQYYKMYLPRNFWSDILSTVYTHIRILEQSNIPITNMDLFNAMDEIINDFKSHKLAPNAKSIR